MPDRTDESSFDPDPGAEPPRGGCVGPALAGLAAAACVAALGEWAGPPGRAVAAGLAGGMAGLLLGASLPLVGPLLALSGEGGDNDGAGCGCAGYPGWVVLIFGAVGLVLGADAGWSAERLPAWVLLLGAAAAGLVAFAVSRPGGPDPGPPASGTPPTGPTG